ncbi:ABC transporter permease [Acidipropionibacterium virtanenii]|uniref:Macrolide export ATP-binding/permease protein MacB n=1 Tax=Acidipropionibacterium virtanenii TaxID=2057246 RepID=A0A344UPV1_9ACTN|nr:FtsX-like permease family protein [Acidipropionibacterium virtanenii]AXE37299.1 Macrolide export ATP-binding/permease protein MacB [Acidipropionibacterium virtanenii]
MRRALAEVRYHPTRYVATLVAIAISIGFMVGVSVFIRSQSSALGQQESLVTSRADVVVDTGSGEADPDEVTSAVKGVKGVAAAEPAYQTTQALQNGDEAVQANVYGLPGPQFRWAGLSKGSWPTSSSQIALSTDAASRLGADVGDQVTIGDRKLSVTGLSDDPGSLFAQTAYMARDAVSADSPASTWLVKIDSGADPSAVSTAIRNALKGMDGMPKAGTTSGTLQVAPAAQYQREAVTSLTGDFDVFKYMLLAFAGIALMVGMIIIFTTFLILLAQRRRQIGLLRAVGASGGQVRGQFFVESLIIGAVGSLLGIGLGVLIALVGCAYTGALTFGLVMPWREVAIEFGIGVLATVLAAFVPSLRATRVAPLEALRPAATVERRRTSIVLVVISCVLLVIGALLAWQSLRAGSWNIAWAMGCAAVLGIAVLISTPVYVPWVIKGLGLLLRPFGPTARLSTSNAVRNPVRTALTTGVLMLAVGIIVTLQVGSSTTQATVMKLIDDNYPVDVTVSTQPQSFDPQTGKETQATSAELPSGVAGEVAKLPNLKASTTLDGALVTSGANKEKVLALAGSDIDQVSPSVASRVKPGTVLVSGDTAKEGSKLVLTGDRGPLTLTVDHTGALDSSQIMLISVSDLNKLSSSTVPAAVWGTMSDRTDMAQTMVPIATIMQSHPDLAVGGGAFIAGVLEQVLRVLLIVMTALFGVAVIIALIGVANTLGLSVLERGRESALLRAMGMQRGSLRLMLFFEAIQMAMAAVLVGVLCGAFFAWLGIRSIFKMAGTSTAVRFSVDWPTTIGLVLICFVAAALASVLPGRRAALATPTEALAEE